MGSLRVTWADIWGPLGVAGELLGALGRLGGPLGRLWEGLRRLHGLFGGHLGGHWVSFGGRWWASGGSWAAWWGHGGGLNCKILIFAKQKQTLGPSQGVQGGTRDAPRMHRGCTKDAPNGKYGGSVKAKGGFFLKSRDEMVAFRCFLQKCTPPQREA